MKRYYKYILLICLSALAIYSCGTNAKVSKIVSTNAQASLEMTDDLHTNVPELSVSTAKLDTIQVEDLDGRMVTLMRATKDESGEMVATDVIDAAVVTARFRHLAERQGKVDIAFQIIVPERMQDSHWQLRFYPTMFALEDSVQLEPVIITGADYRKSQLRGYQQYEKFINRIISDSTRFVDRHLLEVFIERNIPQIYAFKDNMDYVSDEEFLSCYGVGEQEAVDHYTNKHAKRMNEKRKSRTQTMFDRYVPVPIVTEGIRLDTVMSTAGGDFIYNYVETIETRPKLKKVDVVLTGDIFEKDKKIYDIPDSEPLTFYISTLSTFAIDLDKYLTKVIERRVSTSTESHIDFELGRSDVKPELGNNAEEIDVIKQNLGILIDNDIFDLDSITVAATASPEGTFETNRRLALSRSASVSTYFSKYIKSYRDSLERLGGFSVNITDEKVAEKQLGEINFTPYSIPENWDDLARMIFEDDSLSSEQKTTFNELMLISDPDLREQKMRSESWYAYVRDKYYPSLRTVKFNFYLSRKGMVKDTVNTTVLDSVYIKGVQCLKNMDYEEALDYLMPYNDFNTAIAYTALNRNRSAMMILSPMEKTAEVNYLLAILYARLGEEDKAVECYLKAINQNDVYIHRGNLDPEISQLIKAYNLNEYIDRMLSINLDF